MMKKVLEYQQRMGLIQDGDRIVVGFSGGADSVCLLLVLEEVKKEKDISYCAVHVEHGIRGEESLADAEFAKAFCRERGVLLYTYHVDAPAYAAERKVSLEEGARELRYECFGKAKEAFGATKVAVAHHGDDNAETMLFHLARGTGLRGLAGILPSREDIIRPLLCVTREEIEAYLAQKQVSYCIDSTNEDVTYTRNRIRREVLPILRQVNARAVEHMQYLSEQVEELFAYVSREALLQGREGLTEISKTEVWLDCKVIGSMESVLRRSFLHQVLSRVAGSAKDIGTVHVETLERLFFLETGKVCHLPYGVKGRKSYEKVVLKREEEMDTAQGACAQFEGIGLDAYVQTGEPLCLPSGEKLWFTLRDFPGAQEKIPEKTYTKWFDYDKMKCDIFLRTRREGDYLVINSQGNQKKLKDYFINEKIPRDQRDSQLLLADGSHIIWILGHRMSEEYKVTQHTKRVLEVRYEKENEYERNNSSDVYRGTGNI